MLKASDRSSNINNNLLSTYLGQSIAIQYNFADYLDSARNGNPPSPFFVNIWEASLSLCDNLPDYSIEILGTENSDSKSWMWAWNNINGFSEELIQIACDAHEKGEKLKAGVLTESFLYFDDIEDDGFVDGFDLAAIACGLSQRKVCYYRCPSGPVSLYVAIMNPPDEIFEPVSASRFMTITTQCFRDRIIDQKVFLESFLQWNRTNYHWDGNTLTAEFSSKNISFSFDAQGHISAMHVI